MSFVTTRPETSAAVAADQTVSAQAAAIHQLFVEALTTSAESYAITEAANAAAAG